MGKYRIDGPAIVLKGNKVVRYTRAHDEAVTIDDAVAKKLDNVRAVGSDAPSEESKPAAKDSGATPSQQASAAAQTSGKGAAK